MDIARLGKFWFQTVTYTGCGNGKSFFVELVAVSAAVQEDMDRPDYSRAFQRFLIRSLMQMRIWTYTVLLSQLAVEDDSELKMLMLRDMMLAEFYGLDSHVKRLAKAKFGRFYYSILHLTHCSDSPVHEDCSGHAQLSCDCPPWPAPPQS